MLRRTIFGAVVSVTIASGPAAAQQLRTDPLELEPYAGAFVDAYDISPDGNRTGLMVGLRVGYPVAARTRLVGNVAYASSQDVANSNGLPNYWVYDNTWAMTTVGAEYEAIAGRTSASLGLQLGAGWRRNDLTGKVGNPDPSTDEFGGRGFSAMDVVVPGVTLRRDISRGLALSLSLQDQIFDFLEGPAEHSPSVTIGIAVR